MGDDEEDDYDEFDEEDQRSGVSDSDMIERADSPFGKSRMLT